MINKLQQLQCKTKLKFQKKTNDFCDPMNYTRQNISFQFEEVPFIKGADGLAFLHDETPLLMKVCTQNFKSKVGI